ncbi:MAG: exodeoxyribonuclease VII large subunit [Saprospiraceae bacterium]|nr:exodeoxyribonuclease VII large subunit [Saprospiraceae bacterium]
MPASYSLYELNEYIRRVVALNFPEPIWVHCEIAQIKEVRGNVYLDLIHHDEGSDEIKAQISANIWYKSYLFLKNKLGALLPSLLSQGTNVSLKVQVEFSEKYGMKLIIEDIDPAYTIGQMEMKRQKILQQLTDEGLLHLNKLTDLPRVIQKIAVISSPNAAGYIDFINHLQGNSYGYKYAVQLFETALQGLNTERDVCQAMKLIREKDTPYDCILIIRGGGSKPDLAWFDNYNIGTAIARAKVPVITGIGHDIDSTVADAAAYQSLKTPTAVADYLIEHNLDFESSVIDASRWISQIARQMIKNQEVTLASMVQLIKYLPADILRKHHSNIDVTYKQILLAAKNKVKFHHQQLQLAGQQISMSDPAAVLRRGYAIIRQNNKIVTRARQYDAKDEVEIQFADANIKILKK